MHQRISIWIDDGIVENIEADQSYFLAEVNQITRKTFDKNLEKIAPCSSAKYDDANQADASSMKTPSNSWFHVGKGDARHKI